MVCDDSASLQLPDLDPVDPRPYGAMVVINEKSRVPPLDAAALERLSDALDREGVVAAMLIGSEARGNPGPLSDVDIAVWYDPELDSRDRFNLQLDLAGDAARAWAPTRSISSCSTTPRR